MGKDILSASPESADAQSPTLLEKCFQQLMTLQRQRTQEDYEIYKADQTAVGKTPEPYETYAATRFPSIQP